MEGLHLVRALCEVIASEKRLAGKVPLIEKLLRRRADEHGGGVELRLRRELRLVCASDWASLCRAGTLRNARSCLRLVVGMDGIVLV